MRLFMLAVLVSLFGCGSASGDKSSLRACDFDQPCGAGEVCDISQPCGPPGPDGGTSCQAVEGDRLCHRDCSQTKDCSDDETCTEVSLFDRTDETTISWLCL